MAASAALYAGHVLKMFGRRSTTIEAPRVRSRGESKRRSPATTVSVDDFSPDTLRFLGAVAYLQLTVFETLSRAVAEAPDLAGKEAVSTAAGIALGKHQALAAEIKRQDGDPSVVMEPHRAAFDRFTATVAGADWYECLLSAYITTGLLDDFFVRLASGLPSDQRQRVVVLLSSGVGSRASSTRCAPGSAATRASRRVSPCGAAVSSATRCSSRGRPCAPPSPTRTTLACISSPCSRDHHGPHPADGRPRAHGLTRPAGSGPARDDARSPRGDRASSRAGDVSRRWLPGRGRPRRSVDGRGAGRCRPRRAPRARASRSR
ncbi:hypothetical protein BC477_18770 [Clavibacter michiganensis subsp. michiganensis]|uniref:Ferritin-like domain-containing protein n=1 Tax=Clavibacter michiganensis subsp. michiganensis TaxID=33013 RepID=A0A251XH50_CLAMM|nr:hypothetical protein BC477_18770 [Clavibacter michiganensis subsp. michiganensis]OUE01527.1 hypothetical protein CMMCAS07_14555 [Clavibacter michiganensis subsp. michiganensis]